MKMIKKIGFTLTVAFLVCFMAYPAFANKSSVTIDAPDKAVKGSVIKIKLTVNHNGNNFIHHTDWVYLKINGKEIQRWKFSAFNLPESENFSREFEYTAEESGTLNLEAEADCNLHGSVGKVEKEIKIE